MRRIKLLLAVLAALSLFAAACGGSDGDSATDSDATEQTTSGDDASADDSADDDDAAMADDDADDDAAMADDDAMGDCSFDHPDEINVAYFEEWPTANQVAQANQTYDERLCATVNWLPFPSGNEMSLAMESGDIDISYSQGLTPFANAVTSGADLEMVGVAVAYADADQCIVHPDYGITKDNASDFEGQAVYSPIGNVTHFQLLTQLDALGVDISAVNIIPSEGGAAAVAAFESGDVAMACAFGGSVLAMLELGGTPLSTVEEKLEMGIRVFDIISIPTSFGEQYPGAVTEFLQVTEDANAAYAADRASTEQTIADTAGMDLDASNALLDQFIFYNSDTQLSDAWMGGVAQDVMLEQMQFFQEQGEISDALGDYSGFVNTSFLEGVDSYEAGAAPAAAPTACPSDAPGEINVAYFEEWPTANQVAQANQTYDDVLCTTVNWLPFPSGNEMSLAMESGDIDISYSQGLTPFANAVTSGADLEMVGVAVAYADADQCIVHPDYGITKDNASDFEGQAVYSPIGNVTHFQLLTQLDALGVDISAVNIIPSEGGAAAVAAFESGDVAMACAFGGSVLAMLELGGTPLSTVEEKLEMGIRVFDIISIPTSFGEDHPETLVAFLQVTEDANEKFAADRASTEQIIADTAGMELDASNALLDQFIFYDAETQLSDAWMGGVAADVMLEQMQFFQEQGEIADALGDYTGFVNTSFLDQVE